MTGSKQQSGVQTVSVGPERAGQRLDNFLLARLSGVPRSMVYRIIRTGQVRVNGKRARPFHRLSAGDEVRVPPVRARPQKDVRVPEAVRSRIEEAIIHEDEDLIVCDKPAGIAVHAGSGLSWGLIDALRQGRPDDDLDLVHRLDRETSGLLLVTRNRRMLTHLQRQFAERRTNKHYLALLDGRLPEERMRVTTPLGQREISGERMVVTDADGKEAETLFTVVDRFADACLVEATPVTGRTHQIRVHAASVGAPCAGDAKYGQRDRRALWRERGLERLFLHAHRLEFERPDGEAELLSCPLPPDLRAVLDTLERR